jgi:hypothetical protein
MAKHHYYNETPMPSVASVKKAIKENGGKGWTEHWHRGEFCHLTEIVIGNNSDSRIASASSVLKNPKCLR